MGMDFFLANWYLFGSWSYSQRGWFGYSCSTLLQFLSASGYMELVEGKKKGGESNKWKANNFDCTCTIIQALAELLRGIVFQWFLVKTIPPPVAFGKFLELLFIIMIVEKYYWHLWGGWYNKKNKYLFFVQVSWHRVPKKPLGSPKWWVSFVF